LAKQALDLACFLTRCKAGINIDNNSAIIAMTTKSSISVKPLRLLIVTPYVGMTQFLVHFSVGSAMIVVFIRFLMILPHVRASVKA